MSTERWAVRHPGIGILYYDSEQEARVAAGTAGEFLGRAPKPVAVEEALEAGTTVGNVLQLRRPTMHIPDYLILPLALLLFLSGVGICSAIALWLCQREPIDPDPQEVPAPVLMKTITWEQVRPYRYVPAHRLRWDNPGHESRLRVGPWVATTLELPYVDIPPLVSDDTLAQVYQGGQW